MKSNNKSTRNSSIELLKIFAIFLIVISHIAQTLTDKNYYITYSDYIVNLNIATADIQTIVLMLFRQIGVVGNSIFFLSSAWFLLDSKKANKQKTLNMIMDVFVISVGIFCVTLLDRGVGGVDRELIPRQFFPTTYANNWYITCYILFYLVHPILNRIIEGTSKPMLLRYSLVLGLVYIVASYATSNKAFGIAPILVWIALYFIMAYLKKYRLDMMNSVSKNFGLLLVGILGYSGVTVLTNYVGLHYEYWNDKMLYWNSNSNVFAILISFALFNLARRVSFKSKAINYFSGLSLLVYVIHENQLVRTYYRPPMWNYIFKTYGYDKIVIWALALAVLVFVVSYALSIAYSLSAGKITSILCKHLYPRLAGLYKKFETKLTNR